MTIMNNLTGGDGDLWYLWVAFDITFLVLAIEIAITVGSNRRQRKRGHEAHPRLRGSRLTEKP
jgi:heme exporter protein D